VGKPSSQPIPATCCDTATQEPVNASKLAQKLGRSRWYVTAMKKCGYQFRYATLTTLSHALEWLEQHPEFRSQEYKLHLGLMKRLGKKARA